MSKDKEDVLVGTYDDIDALARDVYEDLTGSNNLPSPDVEEVVETANTQLDDTIEDVTKQLSEKYNIKTDKNLVENDSDKELQAQKLISAKIIKSVSEKSRLKRILALDSLTTALSETLLTNIRSAKTLDPDWLNSLGLLFSYSKDVDKMMREYENIHEVENSLKAISTDENKKKEQEEVYNMSTADRQAIINKILENKYEDEHNN